MWRIATRNVLRNRRRSLLTLFAIGFSIMVVISVTGLVNGLQASVKERVILGQTGVVQVHKKGFSDNIAKSPLSFGIENVEQVLDQIGRIPGVIAAAPRIGFFTMLNADDTTIFALGFGVDGKRELATCPRRDEEWGELRVGDDGLVSPEVGKQLGVKTGGDVTLLSPDFEGVLNAANLKIGGMLDNNPAFSSEKKLLYLPLSQAQELLRMPGQAVELAVRSADYEHPEILQRQVQQALGDGYEVLTWKDLAKFVVDILSTQNAALRFVIGVFLLVLLIGIVNTMLMSVLERTREIGTMMAVGVKRRQILEMFIVESTLLGALGAALGSLFGFAVVTLMHRHGIALRTPGSLHPSVIRPIVELGFVGRTVLLAMFGAAAAAIYPARRAAKLKPVEALSSI
jgi:putative ABC transport system permease protein